MVARLSGSNKELFFRDLYYTTLASIADYEKSCSDTIKQIIGAIERLLRPVSWLHRTLLSILLRLWVLLPDPSL
jgi:hypothetical protein